MEVQSATFTPLQRPKYMVRPIIQSVDSKSR
jgi:hypothetical protein